MAAHKNKQDSSLKDMLTKVPQKKRDLSKDSPTKEQSDQEAGTVTTRSAEPQAFMEGLFAQIREEVLALRTEITLDLKTLQHKLGRIWNRECQC